MTTRLTKKKIRAVAESLLDEFGIDAPPIPVYTLARRRGVRLTFGPLPSDFSGFLMRAEAQVVIGVNSDHPRVRQRFTVAHELGHLLLHKGSFVDEKRPMLFRDRESSAGDDPREIDANRFGAELLMPRRMVLAAVGGRDLDNEDEVRAIAAKFGVSLQALMIRLGDLGLQEFSTPGQE